MKTIKLENDKCQLIRNASFNHCVNEQVSWIVFYKPSGLIVCETRTKREAMEFFSVYSK